MSNIELISVEEFPQYALYCYPCGQEGKETVATVVISQLYTPFTGLCAEHAALVEVDKEVTR